MMKIIEGISPDRGCSRNLTVAFQPGEENDLFIEIQVGNQETFGIRVSAVELLATIARQMQSAARSREVALLQQKMHYEELLQKGDREAGSGPRSR
jgi:hypothetical protein